MIGVEPHRAANPLDPLFGAAEPGQKLALLDDNEVAVRIEAQRAFLMIGRLVVLVEIELQRGENPVNVCVVVVERQSGLQLLEIICSLAGRSSHQSCSQACPTRRLSTRGHERSWDRARWRGSSIPQRLGVAFALRA